MMGQHSRSESLFYHFRIEGQVPRNHSPRPHSFTLRIVEKLALVGRTGVVFVFLKFLPDAPFINIPLFLLLADFWGPVAGAIFSR